MKTTTSKDGEIIELISHPKTRQKYLILLFEKYPEENYQQLLYLAEIEARKTGHLNPFIVRARKIKEIKEKFGDKNGE